MPRPLFRHVLVLCFCLNWVHAAEWLHARSENFELFSSGSKSETEKLVQDLEGIRYVFESTFANKPAYRVRTLVIYCGRERDYRPFMKLFNGKRVDSLGQFLGPRDQASIVLQDGWGLDSSRRVIYHEMGHSWVESVFPGVPLWVNEGLAQVFEMVNLDKREFTVGEADPDAIGFLQQSELISMAQIVGATHSSAIYNEGSKRDLYYVQSWAFVHMCLFGVDTTLGPKLGRYIELERSRVDSVACLEEAFGMSVKQLDALVHRYIREGRYQYRRSKDGVAKSFAFEFLPCDAKDLEAARAGMLFRLHQDSEITAQAVGACRQLFNSDNALLLALSSLNMASVGETQLAKDLADRAIACGSTHPRIYLNQILAKVQELPFELSYRMPEAYAEELRGLIDKAMDLYPNNPDLLASLAFVEAFAPKLRMSKLKLLERAFSAGRRDNRMVALMAYIRWRYKDPQTATKLLAQLRNPERKVQHFASSLTAQLEAGKEWKYWF